MKIINWMLVAVLGCVMTVSGQNLLVNGSFEEPGITAAGGGYAFYGSGSKQLTGWEVLSTGVEYLDPDFAGYLMEYTSIGSAQDGNYIVDLAALNYSTGGGIKQTFSTVPGAMYDVNFYLGTVEALRRGDGTAHYTVRLNDTTTDYGVTNMTGMLVWEMHNLTFIASNGLSTITFSTTDDATRHFLMVDNVSVTPHFEPVIGDGISVLWKEQYFGTNFVNDPNATALADPDGDGANNYYEYISGCNPIESHSMPKTIPLSVSTFAGSTPGGQDGYRTNATFFFPSSLTLDRDGKIWVMECTMTGFTSSGEGGHRIRVIDTNGMVTTIAGGSTPGYVDGPAAEARFSSPNAMAFDSKGNVFITDRVNSLIRKLDTNGMVSTFAGTLLTYADKDGQGTNACFYTPTSLCVDSNDNLYVSDFGNYKIRKITPDGLVTTYAGGGAGFRNGALLDAQFNTPSGVAIDPDGNLYVTDWLNGAVRRIGTNGLVSTFAQGLPYTEAVFVDRQGAVYATTPGARPGLYKFRKDGSIEWSINNEAGVVDGPISQARVAHYTGLTLLSDGDLLISDADATASTYFLRQINLGAAPLATLTQAPGSSLENVIMTLSTVATNGVMRYTLDGSIPGTNSPAYYKPFEANANAPLQARVFVGGYPVSEIVSNSNGANYILKLTVSGPGTVSRVPAQSSYPSNSVVQLVATPNLGYDFIGWSGDVTNESGSISITMSTNKFVTANFARTWSLTVTPSSGGTVVKSPDKTQYVNGERVEINAIPNDGYLFDKWSPAFLGTNNPLALTSTTNLYVKAIFKSSTPPVNRLAVATATVWNGFIVAVTIVDGGSGYPENPAVIISGGGGSGATATATVSNGVIQSVQVTDAGFGYTGAPTIFILRTPEPLNRRLIAYYPFDANANDVSINGYNGLATGVQLTVDRFGATNSAYRFTDSTTYIQAPVNFDDASNITVSAWVKFDSNAKGQTFFAQDTANEGLLFGYNIDGNIGMWLGGDKTGFVGVVKPVVPVIGKWYMVTATYDGRQMKLYLDGALVGIEPYSGGIVYRPDNASRIGDGVSLTGYPMQGSIDEVRIYAQALSDEDIALLFSYESPNDPIVSIETKTVRVKMGGLKIGRKYQLESANDMNASSWAPVGAAFTATNLTISRDVDVLDAGRFFRVYEIQQ